MAQLDWLLVQALGCGREDGSGRQEIQTCSERRAGGGAENEPEVSSSPPARELESSRWLEVPSGAVDTPSPPHTHSLAAFRRGVVSCGGRDLNPGLGQQSLSCPDCTHRPHQKVRKLGLGGCGEGSWGSPALPHSCALVTAHPQLLQTEVWFCSTGVSATPL